ncbi:MAG: nucleotidyltransferase [Acholeplasmatales bacterium]|nr:nucleotidyltransferase [Acholeplasmatales bacterium]
MIFGKKKIIDLIIKYFNEKKISYEKNLNIISFSASYNDFSIYPYIKINEENQQVSFLVNIRKINQKENVFEKLNTFNIKSQYFRAILNEDIIVLEYNTLVDSDNLNDILDQMIDSLSSLRVEIKEL